MNETTTARESDRSLQKKTSRPFIEPVSFAWFLQGWIPLSELLVAMTKLCYVHGGLGTANCKQTGVVELLRTIAGFGLCTQERLINSRQEAVNSPQIRCLQPRMNMYLSSQMVQMLIVIICALIFVLCDIRWTTRKRSLVLLTLKFKVWPINDTEILPTPAINEAPRMTSPWL